MKLLKLTLHKLTTVYVVENQIVCFYTHSQKGSVIRVTNGDDLHVIETPESIKSELSK